MRIARVLGMQRAVVVVLVGVLTLLTLLLLAGHGPWAGPVVWELSSDHGLNRGDVPVVAAYLVGLACCASLWRSAR